MSNTRSSLPAAVLMMVVTPVLAASQFLSLAQEPPAAAGHPALEETLTLSAEEAEAVYAELRQSMREVYLVARYELAGEYQNWKRYNEAPYLSETHGNRYVNNYANSGAFDFAAPEAGVVYPAGTILAKDSFTVTQEREIYPGSLFIMEKLSAGASPETADWRYLAIHPDGSIEGDTTGESPEGVAYCHQCHQLRADFDHIFGLAPASPDQRNPN